MPLEMFEKYYLQRREQILKYTPELFEYRGKLSPESEESVLSAFTTWELSFEQLGKDRQQIKHFYLESIFEALFGSRCSTQCHPLFGTQNEWIQCILSDSEWDPCRFQGIVAELNGLSLVQGFFIEEGQVLFSLHLLIKDWLRTRLGERERRRTSVESAEIVIRYYAQHEDEKMSDKFHMKIL